MIDSNYPNYFIAGDSASKKAQKWYIRLVGIDLILMIASAIFSIYNYQSEDSKLLIYIFSGVLLLGALFISIILRVRKYEDYWYSGRALAESCKTLTWRFIMLSEDFENTISEREAEQRFIGKICLIKDQFPDLYKVMNNKYINQPFISSEMKRIRSLSFEERKDYYLSHRVQDQINWYSSKADSNKRKYELWFFIVIGLQFLALISILFLINNPMSNFNFIGFFSTIAASGFSWLQVKRFQENKEAYTMANSELNLIKSEIDKVTSEEGFSEYVLDSENAMSREHTMWLAQKRINKN
ncbi:DUF4231 domain-containing protein [Elizabethkingia ursingii]|uniref:DUF4231 domain-containing protein n=1 Tax=Elizabethkingia ursingii TaxID=1756150 RepID=A0ABX3N7T6_9FLAO|nr:DUF4231 domain-containing protein [Elizabethkingia ursingii]OPB88517.1 hypothetical protein BB021_08195 [Elizabethkingia ursingii]